MQQHWGGDWKNWSTNLTLGIGPTGNQPTEFFQNEFVHHLRHIPPVPTAQPRTAVDAMIDGSLTRWFHLWRRSGTKVIFASGGFSVGTIYQQGFLRVGVRRLQITPTLYSGSWGKVSVRTSVLGRISYQNDGAVLHHIRQTAGIVQPAIAFGQYRTNNNGETIPAWEIELARILSMREGKAGGLVLFGTWTNSFRNIVERDYGPTYGASLFLDVL